MPSKLRVLVWNEFVHELTRPDVRAHYPQGIHQVIADGLHCNLKDLAAVNTATLQEPHQGLSQERLLETDVLLWWGHAAHDLVTWETVDRVQSRVLQGMGLIVLHSGHASRIFQRLMGTGCMLRWREAGECERIWIVNPSHPIVAGCSEELIVLPQSEMYGEFFDIPPPDELITISSFDGGEVFRSGCTFRRGHGKIFYFSPGHETYPIYHDPTIQRILANACQWAQPQGTVYHRDARHCP